MFLEYGVPASTRGPISRTCSSIRRRVESATPYWSIWDAEPRRRLLCRGATTRSPALALEAIYEYWNVDGNNETSAAGVVMLAVRVLLRLELGRAAVPVLSAARTSGATPAIGSAGNWLERPRPGAAAAGAVARPDAGHLSDLPVARDAWLVGPHQAAALRPRRRPRFGPRDAAPRRAYALFRHRADL